MNNEKLDTFAQEIQKISDSIELYNKELAEITKDGVTDEELKKMDEVNASLALAAQKFEKLTKEMRNLASKS